MALMQAKMKQHHSEISKQTAGTKSVLELMQIKSNAGSTTSQPQNSCERGTSSTSRYEMDQCVPLGVAAFQCKSEVRNIRIRKLTTEETKAAEKEAAKSKE